MAESFSRRSAYVSISATCLVVVLLWAPLVRPVTAESDNSNLIQQILATVQRVETAIGALAGVGGSVSTLQDDVGAIQSKTDHLPDDTTAVLDLIKANIGLPLTRMFMADFHVDKGESGSMTCYSTGPYLLHVHAHGLHAYITADLNGRPITGGIGMPAPVDFVLGGNANDTFQLTIYVEDISNPNAYGFAFVTMQTTSGAVVSCG